MKPNLENTPKAKKEFEAWYNAKYEKADYAYPELETFYVLHPDHQEGIYRAYLREHGIHASADIDTVLYDWANPSAWVIATGEPLPIDPNYKFDYINSLTAALQAGFARREAELNQKS